MLLAKPLDPTDRDHACRALWTAFFNPEFEARFNTRLLPVYAMTEGNYIAYPPRGLENHPGSCGKVSPLFDIRIVDETDENVAPGDVGEILWRPRASHMMTAGYLGDPSATVATWRDLWFHTGDQGWLDEEGFLFLIGRMGDQIRRRGTNIPASYVEEAALQFPGVVEAAAIAVPAEFGESEVKLCVIVNGEAPSARTFRDHIRKALPREMWPRYVEFRRELPRVDNFKVSKKLLRAEGDHGHTHATIDLSTLSP